MWVRAERQTGGRGRQGRGWSSLGGNLHASTFVRLRAGGPPPATLSFVAAVAVQELVAALLPDRAVRIKWPNDILADGAKLAGILLERRGDAVIVGFGVNLREAPQDLGRPAASIRTVNGAVVDPSAFLVELAAAFAAWVARWRSEGVAPVRLRWLERAHPAGTALSVTQPDGRRLDGLFDGLAEDGALRLRLADGTLHVMHAGDVFLI